MLRPLLSVVLTRAMLWLMKCHWDCILKVYLIYYIAPPSTHLLFVKHARDHCHSSAALHNLQYDHFLIFHWIWTVVDIAYSHDSLPEQ